MSDIKENQQAKLLFKLADDSMKELDCAVKEIYSDRMSFDWTNDLQEHINSIQEGDDVIVTVITPFGLRRFHSLALEICRGRELVVDFAEEMVREVQRRNYLRVNIQIELSIDSDYHSMLKTHTVDIGGGGLKFYSQKWFEPGEAVKVRLFLPKQPRPIIANGVIVRNDFNAQDHYSLMFTEIYDEDRDKIVQLCFKYDLHKVQIESRSTQ